MRANKEMIMMQNYIYPETKIVVPKQDVVLVNKEYVIIKEPLGYKVRRDVNSRIWDEQKALKLSRQVSLQNQHGDLPLWEGAIEMDVTFYFELPYASRTNPEYINHECKPSLADLVSFLQDVCTDVIFKDSVTITKTTSKKLYSNMPRTEFTISKLKSLH
jgi:Holliday junction resolvase RusA-like endonuclease